MTRARRRRYVLRGQVLAWHRRLGLVVSVVVLIVVVTGFPLNHVDRLGLDRNMVTDEALLDWYGMSPEGEAVSYKVGTDWLTWLQGSLYLNDRRLGETESAIKGAVAVDGLLVVAAPREILVFTADGALVEKLSGAGLPPAPVEAIGLAEDDRVVVRTPDGRFSATVDFLDWTPGAAPISWARPAPLPTKLQAAILRSYRGDGLPWSRVLLDIHTGRILGPWGPYVIDAAALALLVLVATGVYNWFARTR